MRRSVIKFGCVLLTVVILSCCGGNVRKGLEFEDVGESVDGFGHSGPDIFKISNGSRREILEYADVLIFWDGHSKFGGTLFKHNARWYGAGGFMGGTPDFLEKEAKMNGGNVVYVTPYDGPIGKSKYGALISKDIAAINGEWTFRCVSEKRFGKRKPTFRHYYNTNDQKIIYKDY